eukprot:scaffold638_cov66-Phaeocystis_antarctica.AAC.3
MPCHSLTYLLTCLLTHVPGSGGRKLARRAPADASASRDGQGPRGTCAATAAPRRRPDEPRRRGVGPRHPNPNPYPNPYPNPSRSPDPSPDPDPNPNQVDAAARRRALRVHRSGARALRAHIHAGAHRQRGGLGARQLWRRGRRHTAASRRILGARLEGPSPNPNPNPNLNSDPNPNPDPDPDPDPNPNPNPNPNPEPNPKPNQARLDGGATD